jgi:hypothetical protein
VRCLKPLSRRRKRDVRRHSEPCSDEFDSGDANEGLRQNASTAEVMKHLGRRISAVLTDEYDDFCYLLRPSNSPVPYVPVQLEVKYGDIWSVSETFVGKQVESIRISKRCSTV